jgi:predicted nicotinamide N-methyase
MSVKTPSLGVNFMRASEDYFELLLPGNDVRIRLKQELNTLGITGVVWDCGTALSLYLDSHPSLLQHNRILDLGCGGGIVGIAAVKSGASHVVLSDLSVV